MEENQYTQVLNDIESNKDFTKEEYEEYSKSEDFSVRELIAAYEKTPKDILLKLARDNSPRIRLAIIQNVNSDKDIFRVIIDRLKESYYSFEDKEIENLFRLDFNKLYEEEQQKVISVALLKDRKNIIKILFENETIKTSYLKGFLDNRKTEIKNFFFEYNRINQIFLKLLKEDYDSKISKKAFLYEETQNNSTSLQILDNLTFEEKKNRLEKVNSSEDLKIFAIDKDFYIRFLVVRHPFITQDLLEVLSKDISLKVKLEIAKNRLINDSIVINILETEGLSLNKELIEYIFKNKSFCNLSLELQKKLLRESRGENKKILAKNETISNEIQYLLADDEWDFVRETLLNNPNVNSKTLEILSYDNNPDISEIAKTRLNKSKIIEKNETIDRKKYVVSFLIIILIITLGGYNIFSLKSNDKHILDSSPIKSSNEVILEESEKVLTNKKTLGNENKYILIDKN